MKRAQLVLAGVCALAAVVLHFPVLQGEGLRLALDQRLFAPWQATLPADSPPMELAQGRFNLLSTDSNFWYLGQIRSTVNQIRQGVYPAWDPWTLCGTPLAAQLGLSPWYPPNLLLLAGPPLLLLGWLAAFHTALAGYLMARLLMRLGASKGSALVGGLAFGLGPWLCFRINNPSLLASAAWTPLLLEAALGVATGSRPGRASLLLGLAFGLSLAAGMPQLAFVSLWGALLLGGITAWRRGSGTGRRALWLAGGALLGLLLGAPALLPAADLYLASIRAANPEISSGLRLLPGALPGLFSAELFGGAADLAGFPTFQEFPLARALLSGHPQDNPLENCLHPGGVVLVLVFLALAGGLRSRATQANWLPGPGTFLGIALGALVLTLRPPGLDPLYRIPGLGPEEPRRMLLLFHVALVAVGILGLERATTLLGRRACACPQPPSGPVRFVALACLVWAALILTFGWLWPAAGKAVLAGVLAPLESGEAQRLVDFYRRTLLWPAAAAAAAALAVAGLRTRPALLRAGLGCIVALELLSLGWRTNPAPCADQLDADAKSRTIAFLEDLAAGAGPEGPPRLLHLRCFHALQGNLISWKGIPVLSATHPLPSRRLLDLLTLVEPELLDRQLPRGVAWLRHTGSVNHPLLASARVGLFAVTDQESAAALEREGLRRLFPAPGREAEHEGVALFENRSSGPRARLEFAWVEVSGPQRARAVLADSPTTLVLEPPGPLAAPEPPSSKTSVEWIACGPGTCKLRVDTGGGRGVLVLADSWYPGWRARVDGRRAALFPAGLAFMALEVGPGRHEVVLEYREPSLPLAVLLQALGLAGAAGLFLVGRGRAGRGETRDPLKHGEAY